MFETIFISSASGSILYTLKSVGGLVVVPNLRCFEACELVASCCRNGGVPVSCKAFAQLSSGPMRILLRFLEAIIHCIIVE